MSDAPAADSRAAWRELPVALVLTLDPDVVDRVAASLAGLAQVHRADPVEDAASLAVVELRPGLCVLDVDDAGEACPLVLAALRRGAPAAALVALGDEGRADVVLACMRAGALDLLARRTDEVALRRALRGRMERGTREAAPDRQGHAYALLPARPADPGRWHALALAVARQKAGQRTLFLDLGEGSRETEVALDLSPGYSVSEALGDLDRLDQALLSSAVPRHGPSGLSALLLQDRASRDILASGDLPTLLVLLRGVYDEVVLHAPLALAASRPMMLGGLRRFAVVTTQNLASAQEAAEALRKMAKQGMAVAERAVLLVAEHHRAVLPAPRALAGSIGVVGVVSAPDQRARLCNAINQGRFAEEALRDARFARALADLSALLREEAAPTRRWPLGALLRRRA